MFVTKDLGFKPGVLARSFAVGGLSSLFGALLARRSARRFGLGPSMWGGLILMGVAAVHPAGAGGDRPRRGVP